MSNTLGLGADPRFPTYIFVGSDMTDDKKQYLWYSLDNEGPVPIFDPALTGKLIEVRGVKTMYKDKPNYKFDFVIQADAKYVIRSGVNTIFSRGVMLAIEELISDSDNKKDLDEMLLSFITSAGDEDNVVYGNVFDWEFGETVFPEWDKEKKINDDYE